MHSDLEIKLLVPKFHVAKDGHLEMHSDLEMKLQSLICYHEIDHKVEWTKSGIELLHNPNTCAMTMPTISGHLCRPFPINFTNLCAMHRASLLPCNNNVIWVDAMANLLPFIIGTYFFGAFLA